MAQDNITNLYNAISSKYDLGTEEQFRTSLKDANNRSNLYKALNGKYDLGSEDDFNRSLGYGKAEAPTNPTPQQTPQPQQNPQAPASKEGLTWQDQMAMSTNMGKAQSVAENAAKGVEELGKATKNASPFGGGNVGLGNNQNLRKGQKTFDAEKGAFVDTYLTSNGRKFNDINQANQVQVQLDNEAANVRFNETMKSLGIDVEGDKDKDINHLLGDAYEELHQLEAKEQEIAKKESASRKGPRFPSMVGGSSETYTMSEESKNLSSAKRLLQRRIDALETARDKSGFWSGVGDVLTDPSSYSFGLTDLADASAMANISKKIEEARENGVTPNLTDSEKALARNYMLNQQAQGMNKDNFWNEMGQSFGQTLSFMKDFAITGGGFMGIAKGGMALGAKGGKALGDYMVKNLGTKALGKTMEYIGKGLGLAAGAEAGGLALNNTAQAASSMADIMNKQMGNLTVGKDGNLSFEGSKSLGEAVLKSQLSRGGENASELVGLAFDAVPGILGKVIQRTKVGQFAKKIANSKYWKGYEKGMNYLGVQSLWGEGMEEEYNMARDVIIGESGWFKDPNDPSKPAFFDGEQQLKTWETVGITSMLLRVPSMIATGTQAANYYANQYNLNTSDRNMRSVFGDVVRYESVKAMMDGADNAQLAGVLNNLMNNAQLSREEKEAMFMYANDLVKVRGFNIGNVVAAANGFKEPPKVSSYAVRGNSFDELDADGNVIAHHEYDTADEMKAGLYEAQQTRFDNDLQSDISAMEARPNNQFGIFVQDYLTQAQLNLSPEELEEIVTKPSMARTEAEQQIVTQFAKALHDAVYDNTMLHEEQSAQDGVDAAESASIDVENPDSENIQEVTAAWQAAQQERNQLFVQNEELKQEVEQMEQQGMSHQEIISALETFRPNEVQTVINYYNQKARFEGMMNQVDNKINEEAANSRQRHEFKGTVNGNADLSNVYTITDGTNEYYLVSGNVTTDSDGRIIGSDSGLIIGMDLDGSFVNIGDTNGYSVMPSTQSLDQFEEQERIRLQELWTGAIDPNGTMMPQEQQTGEVGGEAGVSTDTGANEPSTPESAIEEPQPVQIPVDEKTGVKMYEQGVPVDDAINDMEADGLDVNAESDLAINEAQAELDKLGQPKTRAERVKNDARRKELQNIIDYYNNVQARYAELHPIYADAAPFIAQMNAATSKKKADEILNAALQAGVNPEEINPVHTQKVSDIITKEEERRKNEEEITDKDSQLIRQYNNTKEGRAYLLDRKRVPNAEKRRKIAALIYGDLFDNDFEAVRDLRELISSWLGKGRALDPDSFGQELGWDMSVGKDAAKVSTMFTARRENGGDGMLFNDFVHMVSEASGGRFDTQEVRNELLEMFRSAQEKSDLTEYQLMSHIAEAEARLVEEEQQAADTEEFGEEIEEGQPTDTGMLPFSPSTDTTEDPFAQNPSEKSSSHPNTRIGESVPVNDSNRPTETDNQPAWLGVNSSELTEGKDRNNSDTIQENEEKSSEKEDYLTSHPLTEEQIMADTEATEDEKLAAIDYLKGEDESGISQFYYDQIYQRSQQQRPEPKSEPNPDIIETIQQKADEFRRDQQKAQDQKDIDDALKEFNDFLDNAKGSNIIDKFMHKGLEDNDKAEINLVTLLTGTNAAQQAFMKDLLRLGTKVGYAYIKSGIHDFQTWSKQMSETIGQKLKDVLNWEDSLIGEFLDELWNQKYTVNGERLRLKEHAEKLKNNKGTDTTVNVNKQEDNVTENVVSLQGDSAEFADRQEKVNALSEEIARLLKQAVLQGENKLKTMQSVKALAKEFRLDDMSMTDLQELVEAEVVSFARDIAQTDAFNEWQKFENIKRLYEAQPSLNARDNDRIDKQQYSTPAPMAYLMGLFVDPKHKAQSGLEPSAGNGMLTIALPKEIMHVNDIDEMRLSNLQKQGFGKVTSQDGTQPFKGKFDVIVTNPPFGTAIPTIYDGIYEISALEHQMAINALESMRDDGRAAIIIGGNTEYKTNGAVQGKDRVFLNYLYSHYNVVDVINMDGKTLYSRQGTGYPVRMILINGRKKFDSESFAPVKSKARAEQVKTYEELYNRVNDDILSDSNKPASVHDTESGESHEGDTSRHDNTSTTKRVQGVRNEGGGRESDSSNGRPGLPVGEPTTQAKPGTDKEGHGGVRGRTSTDGSWQQVAQTSGSASTQGGEQGTDSSTPRGNTERVSSESGDVGRGSRGPGNAQQDNGVQRGLGTEKVPYRQQSTNPFNLQSQMPAGQADVVKKALEEIGDVDSFLVKELGYNSIEELHHALAAEQIDSVALAIHQMNQGSAFIIGDQTGVGKGRQGAALIRYGVKKGGNPVYVTQTKELFSDMYRDLADIGSGDLKPFIWSADDDAADITDSKGNVVYKRPSKKEQQRVTDYILKHGKLPPEYDYIITSYSMFNSGTMDYENGNKKARSFGKKSPSPRAINGQAKRDAFEQLASNSYVLMDESHNAGGEDSAISGYLQYITTRAKGVTFLSATFAKRPGNMPIYSLKTAIAKAGVEVAELIDAVKRGGATFQEIMSRALTEAGQMIRRERDMRGVTIDWKGIDDEAVIEKQRQQYDQIIGLFNDIIQFQRTYVDPIINKMNDDAAEEQGEVDHTPGTRDMGINNVPFASRTYNMVQQVLLSLKVNEAVKRAIEHLKEGRVPVIALSNTNEGAADEAAGATGEDMEMPDLSVNLKKGLQGTLRIKKKDAFGNEVNEMIPFEQLSPEGQKRYAEIMDAIEKASTGLSLSPIDEIKNGLKKAGYKVDELTGRSKVFEYNEDGTVKRVSRKKENKKVAAKFNNGELDALVINRSAGTGISLHASSKNPVAGQKQRVMIVVQAQPDVNQEVQMRGRIDRTGQVFRGMYEYVVSQIPSEQRLLMMLKAKLRSLDANTTSSQKSKFNEMQVQDIINKYGDEIVTQYLAENPDLAAKMLDPLKWGEGFELLSPETLINQTKREGEAGGTASKVLGRMALLTVKEQEKMLAEISTLYQAEIDRLNEMGENDLEITEMPLKAKTLSKEVWEQGIEPGGNNPFADNSYVEKVSMDVLKKPMKGEEVKAAQERMLGGKTWEEYKQSILDRVEKWAEQKKAETTETITERAKKKAEAEQEKYVKGAKKAQDKNEMTDAEIERNGKMQYDAFFNQEMEKLKDALASIDAQKQVFVDALETFNVDDVYALPSNIYDLGGMTFEPGFGKLIDIKLSDNFSTNASTITFATLDGRRKITIPINGRVKQQNGEKRELWPVITSLTAQARSGFFGQNVANTRKVLMQSLDNWDKLTSSAARKDGYIITGNLLKALVSTREQGVGGKLISYTTDTGEVRQGILMPDNFEPAGLTAKTPISTKKEDLKNWQKVESADGDVKLRRTNDYDHRNGDWGYYTYEISVPKSARKGGKFFNDEVLRSLMKGQFEGSTRLKAEFWEENLDAVMKRLDELGVTVQEEHKEEANRAITTYDPMEAINQAAESWNQEQSKRPSSDSNKPDVEEIAKYIYDLPKKYGFKGAAITQVIGSREELEALRGKINSRAFDSIEESYNDPGTAGIYLPKWKMVVVFSEKVKDAKDGEHVWWHEQTHSFWHSLPEELREKYGSECLEYLKAHAREVYFNIKDDYKIPEWKNEACSYLIEMVVKKLGTDNFLATDFASNEIIRKFASELKNFIRNGKQQREEAGNRPGEAGSLGREDNTSRRSDLRGWDNQQEESGPEEVNRRIVNPLDAIRSAADSWKKSNEDRQEDIKDLSEYSAKQVYHERINRVETMFSEAWQDDMVTFKAGQDAIAHDEDIPDSQNAYQAMNLSYGKTYNEQEQFTDLYKKPLLIVVNQILKKMGWRMGDVDRYLFTKHGLERNRELYVRDWLQSQRNKSISTYEDLNPDEQELFEDEARRIEERFDDGLIATEEAKEKELAKALKKVHQQYLDDLESAYVTRKQENYQKLMEGEIDFPQYLGEIDYFIQQNIDGEYDASEHDYSGFTEMYGDEEGEFNEDEILSELMGQEEEMGDELKKELWNRINLCSQYGLEKYRTSGMVSDETYKRITNMFHWYVPMRGFNEGMAAQDHWQYMTAKDGASTIGGLLRKAKGRKSQAGFPLATLFGMTYKAIADGNQNDVKKHFWRLCQAHENDLVVTSDAWAVLDPVTGEWIVDYPKIDSDMSHAMVEAKVKEFTERMKELELEGNAKRIKGKARFDYKVDPERQREHIVEVLLNGDRKMMIVTGNPRMAQAINGQLRYHGNKGAVNKALSRMKHFMQSMSTSFNLTFVGRNMSRDWTHFGAILSVREGIGYENAAQKYYWAQFPRMISLFKKYRAGTLDMKNEIEADFKDFMDNGGITGFVHMQKVEAIEMEMEKFMEQQKDGKVLRLNENAWSKILDAIEAMNEAVENNARFATYRASRHYAGRTKARSAYDAKEVTVNFNKKGAGKNTAGFKTDKKSVEAAAKIFGESGQILSANKMFFNATVQAICTIFKNTQNKDGSLNWPYITKLGTRYALPPFLMALAIPMINQMLLSLAGGGDGDDPYANLPEWVRRKSICLYMGWVPGCGKQDFLILPIGQELAAFYSLGDMLAGMTYAENLRPIDKDFTDEMLGFFNVFSPVDFDTKITSDNTAPVSEYVGRVYSVAAPLVAIGENVSWMGKPIFRADTYNNDRFIPEYKMAYNSTNSQFVEISKWLNDVTGGDDVSRGWLQINPATMQYLVEQYTGGPGKLFANTFVSAGKDLKNLITNDEVDFNIRKIEGVRAFYQQGDERTSFYRAQAKYRKYKEEADELNYKINTYVKYAPENPEYMLKIEELAKGKGAARMMIIKQVDKTLKDLNTAANLAEGRDRKNIRSLYNEQLKYIVDELDKVGGIK